MPTLIEPTVPSAHSAQRHETEPSAALIGAHSEVAASVAEFDLDDSTLWQQVDSLVADTAGAAYALTEAVTGEPAPRPARGAPPVVRVRKLATAQRRLFAALDRCPEPGRKVIDRATDQVRALNREMRCAAQSATGSTSEPNSHSHCRDLLRLVEPGADDHTLASVAAAPTKTRTTRLSPQGVCDQCENTGPNRRSRPCPPQPAWPTSISPP